MSRITKSKLDSLRRSGRVLFNRISHMGFSTFIKIFTISCKLIPSNLSVKSTNSLIDVIWSPSGIGISNSVMLKFTRSLSVDGSNMETLCPSSVRNCPIFSILMNRELNSKAQGINKISEPIEHCRKQHRIKVAPRIL